MDPVATSGHDPVLLRFLLATETAESQRIIADLVSVRAAPTIRQVVRRTLYAQGPRSQVWLGEDVEDIAADAALRVLGRLRAMKNGSAPESIQHFDAYVAQVALHACYEHLRRRDPARARLRNQVWYVMTRHPHLRIVRGQDDRWMCSLPAGASGVPSGGTLRARPSLADLICEMLRDAQSAIELNDLVDRVGRHLGVLGPPPGPPAHASGSGPDRIPDAASTAPAVALEQAEFVRTLWREVQQLPLRQRTALLLNLRDAHGGDALDLLTITGTASLRQIAAALEMPPEELARLWPELPLDDHAVAARLRVTRQQVINLRKAARARLGRRLRAETRL